MWPSRSPDLTVCDFHLWGYLKNKVYAKKPPHIRRNERLYQDRSKLNNRRATNACESEFPITVPKMCECRRTIFPTTSVIMYVIFNLHYDAWTKWEKCHAVYMPGQRKPITHCSPAAFSPASPATGREKLTVYNIMLGNYNYLEI